MPIVVCVQAEEKKQQDLRNAALAIAREDSQLRESDTASFESKSEQYKPAVLNMQEEEMRVNAKLESKTTSKEKSTKKKSKFKFSFKKIAPKKAKLKEETAETNSKEAAPSQDQTPVENIESDEGAARPDSSLLVFM